MLPPSTAVNAVSHTPSSARASGVREQRQAVAASSPPSGEASAAVQRLLVERVGERAQIGDQIADLLVTPERADGRERAQAAQLQRALEHLEVADRPQQHDHLAGPRASVLHQLGHALGQQPRLRLAPELGVRQPRRDRSRRGPPAPPSRGRRSQQQLRHRSGLARAPIGAPCSRPATQRRVVRRSARRTPC